MTQRAYKCQACGAVVAKRRDHRPEQCAPGLRVSETHHRARLQAKAKRLGGRLDSFAAEAANGG